MNGLSDEVLDAARSLVIESPDSFLLWETRFRTDGRAEDAEEFTLHAGARRKLRGVLYRRLHCRLSEGFVSHPSSDEGGTSAFVNRLSAANKGTGTWQAGWVVRGFEDDTTIAEQHGVRFWVPKGGFRPDVAPAVVGSVGRVWVPKEGRNWVPGFYWVLGDADQPRVSSGLIRVYWNVAAQGSAPLMERLTTVLNEAELPFHFKTVSDPAMFARADSAVLYLPRATYDRSVSAIAAVYHDVASLLSPDVSVFVKRLAPGLGLAEDAGDGRSFGLYCCGLIADALVRAEGSPLSPGERCDRVFAHLRDSGLDPERLYLNPGSVDNYELIQAGSAADHA